MVSAGVRARNTAKETVKLADALRGRIAATEVQLLKTQCALWSELASDLTWISDRQLSDSVLNKRVVGNPSSDRYWVFLVQAYEGLGLSKELALSNVEGLRDDFAAVSTYGPLLTRPPMDRLAVAASVGAVRGQVCTLVDLLAERATDRPVHLRARKLLVKVSVALPTVLLFMASTNANEIPEDLQSFGRVVVRAAEWGLEQAGKPEAYLAPELVQQLSLGQPYLSASLEAGRDVGFDMQ